MHDRADPEHRIHGLTERFGPVEHDQEPGLDVQAPIDQIGQDTLHDGGVLRVTMRKTDRDLRSVRSDRHGDNENLVGEVDTVDHQHGHIQPGEIAGEKFFHRCLGRGDEPARHRRFRHRPGLQRLADWFTDQNMAAGRDTGQHPLDNDLLKQIIGREHIPRARTDLTATANQAASGPFHADLAATEHNLTSRSPMPVPRTIRILRMLRTDLRGELLIEKRPKHGQASRRRERQQPFTHRFCDRRQRDSRLQWHPRHNPGNIKTNNTNNRYLLHGDPFSGLSV